MKFHAKTSIVLSCAVAALLAGATWALNQPAEDASFTLTRSEQGYSLKAQEAKVSEVLRELSRLGATAIEIDDKLDSRVTADLKDASIEQVLQALTKSRALVYEQEGGQERLAKVQVTSQQDEIAPAASALPVVAGPAQLPRGVLTNTERPLDQLRYRDAQAIWLEAAVIDTKALTEAGREVMVPEDLRADADTEYYLVQFNHTLSSADQTALEAAGAVVGHYVPNRTYSIKVSPDQLAAIRAVPGVYAVTPFHPYYKLSAPIRDYVTGDADENEKAIVEQGSFNVMTFPGVDVQDALAAAGVQVVGAQKSSRGTLITLSAKPEQLSQLAQVEGVRWLEPAGPRKAMNDLGARRMRVSSLRALHPALNGEGVTVAVTDTGIDFNNPGFSEEQHLPTSTNLNSRIAYYEAREGQYTEGLPGDNDGHGTHVSGSIMGNGALSASVVASPGSDGPPYGTNQFAGVAPRARLVMLEDFNSFSDTQQTAIAYGKGARISNNSWGYSASFTYGAVSELWDELVRDAYGTSSQNDRNELIVFFAAGNAGNGNDDGTAGLAGTVSEPGNAKNVITIGALEQARRANNIMGVSFGSGDPYYSDRQSDTDWQVASFSSRGPVAAGDPRIKPDLMAPGSYVLSVQSHETMPDLYVDDFSVTDYRFGNVDTGTNFAYFQGTSMATPLAAGAAALMYQHLTNVLSAAPSPALMKALMISGARPVHSLLYKRSTVYEPYGTVDDGWGVIDVGRSIDGPRIHATDGVIMMDQDQTQPLNTDQSFSYQVVMGANDGGLKVSLAWTDIPGAAEASAKLVNDLDLIVFGPNGGVYRGNRFDADGVHSFRLNTSQLSLLPADQFNNVEVVTIPSGAGTYTIRVYGGNVPSGPQDYALVVQKGIGLQGRTPGNFPSLALDTSGAPVIAYSYDDATEGGFSNLSRQVIVKRWVGSLGDGLDRWNRLEDQWYDVGNSIQVGGVDKTLENSEYPALAVQSTNMYVAWEEGIQFEGPITNKRIFVKSYNGLDWVALGGSATGYGISGQTGYDAERPVLGIMSNRAPFVAWLQRGPTNQVSRVFAAMWNGTNWVGLAGSNSNGIPSPAVTKLAVDLDLAINSANNPVLSWKEETNPDGVVVVQWTGSTWFNISPADSPAVVSKPRIASGPNGRLALAWVNTYNSNPGIYQQDQVYAALYNGSSWSAIGASQAFPGISGGTNGNERPVAVDVAIGFRTNVVVTWQAGASNEASVLARQWQPGATSWVGIAGAQLPPGIAGYVENFARPSLEIDASGLPLLAVPNTLSSITVQEVLSFALLGDRDAPSFAGLQLAQGGTNGNVNLAWEAAADNISTVIVYTIYRGTQTFACGLSPNCDATNVFGNPIATVTNLTSYQVTGLVANLNYCFGVRAADTNGLQDANVVTRSAGPVTGAGDNDADCLLNGIEVAIGTEPCVKDTDGDGMWDGWEWTFSTNNLSKTNAISGSNTNKVYLNPLDNGVNKVNTTAANDGDTGQLPEADLDGDGASNYEEFQWWSTFGASSCSITNLAVPAGPNPTQADTDGDGMPDGWEMINGLSPINPADAAGDLDADGLTNLQEFQYGTDPRNTDSDGDGLTDGNEVNLYGSNPAVGDSDADGLDDGYEVNVSLTSPRVADSDGNFLSDGDSVQLGLNPLGAGSVYSNLLFESFEATSGTRAAWTTYPISAPPMFNMWHLSTVEPVISTGGIDVVYFGERTTSTAYRAAYDPSTTDSNATYNLGVAVAMALQSPTLTNSAAAVSNLFVGWTEYYETEPNFDQTVVQVRALPNTNWVNVSAVMSGLSGVTDINQTNESARWVNRLADASAFAGRTNVQIRFLFSVLNAVNNSYRGWWVDDVRVFDGTVISGWVRDNNGAAIQGATVRALGRGGITNRVNGHQYVLPGKVFMESVTAEDGSYRLAGLPQGNFYLKASAESFRDEFYDGLLFTNGYAFSHGFRPGVYERESVTANGLISLLSIGASTNAYFELERGQGTPRLGIVLPNGSGSTYPTFVGSMTPQAWNGSTSAPALVSYQTSTNPLLAPSFPDWLTNAVAPRFLTGFAPGYQYVYAGTNLPLYPLLTVDLREGESSLLVVGTNQAASRIFVTTSTNIPYRVRVNGRLLTNTTPAIINVLAGMHEVTLQSTGATDRIGTRLVTAPIGGRADVNFGVSEVLGAFGFLKVSARDPFGNALSNLTVYVNGQAVTSNEVGGGTFALPTVLLNQLRPGSHAIAVSKNGYRATARRPVSIFSEVTNETAFVLYEADSDFDRVGDALEIESYTNVFFSHRDVDADGDGLSNLEEFDLFQLFGVRLNIFNPDTDGDALSDGAEVGYDGYTNRYAYSVLYTNAVQFAPAVRSRFVGRYLAGVDNFGIGPGVVVSIEGDRLVGDITHPLLTVPNKEPALTVFTNITTFPSNQTVSAGHVVGSPIFADSLPHQVDTDGDTMWDGFEYLYRTNAALDILDNSDNGSDPDADGLVSRLEFLGLDGLANTNDWINPGKADTDNDFMPDGWEFQFGLDPRLSSDAFQDLDGDGLINLAEFLSGSSPRLQDTDADFLPDYEEVVIYLTDPNNADFDNDGLLDGREVFDKDMDGIQDGGFFPMWAGGDLDVDGLVDGPTDWDTDGDGMPDGFEVLNNFGQIRPITLNPYNPTDGSEDADGDGLSNLEEYLVRDALFGNHPSSFSGFLNAWYSYTPLGWVFTTRPYSVNFPTWDYTTDPFDADSDRDGLPDGYEVLQGLHPMDPVPVDYNSSLLRFAPLGPMGDLDQDGLWNELEYRVRFALDGSATTNSPYGKSTNPWSPDSDGDGLVDGFEYHALFANPTEQDTDGDRLMDGVGVTNKWGEVQSERRLDYEIIGCDTCTWNDALIYAASIPHPDDPSVFGSLALISDAVELGRVKQLIVGNETNIALGAMDSVGDGDFDITSTGEPFVFHNFATNEPINIGSPSNAVYMRPDGFWGTIPAASVIDHFVVEWAYTPVTNHYDQATNDLWELVWPLSDSISRPYWQAVAIQPDSPRPPSRWGASMVYNPAFERKARRFNGDATDSRFQYSAVTVLDNRKMVLMGGVDGVDRYSDIWEFSIRSNEWRRSSETLVAPSVSTPRAQALYSGLSDFGAVLLMGYRNTKASVCGCVNVPWDCTGDSFGEPKSRPWNYGFKDSSYDMTYILGGWNDQNQYLLPEPMATLVYKSTDDPDPAVELNGKDDDSDGWSASVSVTTERYVSNVLELTTTTNTILGYGKLLTTDDQVPVGSYSDSVVVETTEDAIRTVNTIQRSNLVAGTRMLQFPFVPNCDLVSYAALRLDVSKKPLATTEFTVIAEYDEVVRTSREYVETEEDGGISRVVDHHPYTRLNRPFNSSPLNTVFTNYVEDLVGGVVVPNTNSSILEIDVTAIVNELISSGNWRGEAIGFLLMETNGVADYALFRNNESRVRVDWVGSYKQPPEWRIGTRVQTENGEIPSQRKSFGLVYAHVENRLILFGGMNGRQVFGDTYEATLQQENDDSTLENLEPGVAGPNSVVGFVSWTKVSPPVSPQARWGHSMVYDETLERVVLFGGFDANNQPLNDVWEYDPDTTTWTELTVFQDGQKPSPRGGAMMAYYGGEFYKRNAGENYRSTRRDRIVLFGGTDGKNYYNDTWVLYRDYQNFILTQTTSDRWTLVDPGGEQALGPSPRAFGSIVYAQNGGRRPDPTGLGPYGISDTDSKVAASATILLFGGRTGTLPSSPDTDRDLVPDGQEHELGGKTAGRDPRINALINPDGVETVPYNIKRLGAWPGAMNWLQRRFMADLEVVSYPERGEAWRSALFTWQGWPLETSFTNESYVIGDETQLPFETPYTDRVVYVTGVDALSPDWTNLWYHRYPTTMGDARDTRDVWQLGIPGAPSAGSNAAPPYAYSGRWVYGTRLDGYYPVAASMELYSPIFNLTLPDATTPNPDNANSYFLMFHEWVDIADSNDVIRVDVVRPSTPADIANRVTGLNRPAITLVPNRNNSANTFGKWRRVIVALNAVGNDTNLYVRFTLQSDTNALVAGGWYIDDVAILQGAQINGVLNAGTNTEVCLLGEVFNDNIQQCTLSETNGNFEFGFLPLGNYQLVSAGVTNGPYVLASHELAVDITTIPAPEFTGMHVGSAVLTWTSTNIATYRLDFTTDLVNGAWSPLAVITGEPGQTLSYTDTASAVSRIYRVSVTNAP